MKKEDISFWKSLFLFVCTLPYKLFCVGYFVFTLPMRLRRMHAYKVSPKVIQFRRLTGRRVSALAGFALVRELRAQDNQEDFPNKRPSLFDLLEELWNEGMSHFWKIPTIAELESIREKLIRDIAHSPLCVVPSEVLFIWALDEDTHMFTAYCPFTKEIKDAGVPKNLGASVLRGMVPDSEGEHFVYAVSVTVQDAP